MGEVLADAAALRQHFVDRRRHRRRVGIELEVAMDAAHQVGDRLEPVAAGAEYQRGVSERSVGPRHERARLGHAGGAQAVLRGLVEKRFAYRFPRQ